MTEEEFVKLPMNKQKNELGKELWESLEIMELGMHPPSITEVTMDRFSHIMTCLAEIIDIDSDKPDYYLLVEALENFIEDQQQKKDQGSVSGNYPEARETKQGVF